MCFLLLFKHMAIERYQVCVSTRTALSRALGVKQVDGPSSPAHQLPPLTVTSFTPCSWTGAKSSLF